MITQKHSFYRMGNCIERIYIYICCSAAIILILDESIHIAVAFYAIKAKSLNTLF